MMMMVMMTIWVCPSSLINKNVIRVSPLPHRMPSFLFILSKKRYLHDGLPVVFFLYIDMTNASGPGVGGGIRGEFRPPPTSALVRLVYVLTFWKNCFLLKCCACMKSKIMKWCGMQNVLFFTFAAEKWFIYLQVIIVDDDLIWIFCSVPYIMVWHYAFP